jgi:zinc/manganese transport system ATP-binding protein
VPQKPAIDPDMPLRARDVAAQGTDGNRPGFPLPSAARRELADEALRAVGAEAYAGARVGGAAGGEQGG